jgi:hypothetical protein
MATTTGGFSSEGLALEAKTLELESLSQKEAIEIGEIALDMGFARGLTYCYRSAIEGMGCFSRIIAWINT